MVGLNFSRSLPEQFQNFRNFHDPTPRANDFKIRYAFTNTAYYGAYMTDIVKNFPMLKSAAVLKHLRTSPSLLRTNLDAFREELQDLNAQRPSIFAFGWAAHELLDKNLHPNEYSTLIRLTHYSHQIGKESYRETVLTQIRSRTAVPGR